MAAEFEGRVALVTGASGGIGAALAVALAGTGADVVLTYAGHQDQAQAAADQVRREPAEIVSMAMLTNGDLTSKVVTVDGGIYPT